jgi:putative DNA primase/helicase
MSNTKIMFTADVRYAAKGRWMEILAALAGKELELFLPGGKYRIGQHGPCPVHGGRDGFRFFRNASETGGGVCNTCGTFSDGFSLLRWLQPDKRFPQVVEDVAMVLGMTQEQHREGAKRPVQVAPMVQSERGVIAAKPKASDEFLRKLLQEAWAATIPVTNAAAKPLQRYLRNRGLSERMVARIPTIRFHSALPYINEDGKEEGKWPAMVAMFTDPKGRPVTLHRTYLTISGHKAPVKEPKKLMAYPSDRGMVGGAVRLAPLGSPVLGIAEGVETSLAVIQATGMPVWAGLTATLLERFAPPESVRTIVHWADLDRSGRGAEAARHLKDRLKEQGIAVKAMYPTIPIAPNAKGADWNDVLSTVGIQGFPLSLPRMLRPQAA